MGHPPSARYRRMEEDRADRAAHPTDRLRIPHLTESTRDHRSRGHHRHRLPATATGLEPLTAHPTRPRRALGGAGLDRADTALALAVESRSQRLTLSRHSGALAQPSG